METRAIRCNAQKAAEQVTGHSKDADTHRGRYGHSKDTDTHRGRSDKGDQNPILDVTTISDVNIRDSFATNHLSFIGVSLKKVIGSDKTDEEDHRRTTLRPVRNAI